MKSYNERINTINDKVKTKRKQRVTIWTASSVACVLLVLTVVCSLPLLGDNVPNVNAYKDDQYYPIIEKINALYSDNRYSIFDKFGNSVDNAFGDWFGATDASPTSPAPDVSEGSSNANNSNKYEETTLNQVDGVIEGDLLKRSTTHAFYLKDGYTQDNEPCLMLKVYKLAGVETNLVKQYSICAKDDTRFSLNKWSIGPDYKWVAQGELFLNSDATRLTVLTTCVSKQSVTYTTVISLDVSDPSNITEVNRVYVSGSYLSARKVDNKLLVITNFTVRAYYWEDGYQRNNIDYAKRETYVPQCGSTLGGNFIPLSDIHVPNDCQNVSYTVLAMLDEASLEVDDSYAVFSYTQDVYVSQDYVVVMRDNYYYDDERFDYGQDTEDTGVATHRYARVCELVALNYKNGFVKVGEIGLDGYVKDRYSMDEKDGVLRVFVTLSHSQSADRWSSRITNASLYCVDLSNMQIIASKERFAPSGDEVKSARFDGDKAYVCTARRNTDPVFFFDLSDLNNITYVDTGEIDGFSDNLIKFNDLLLGIGQGANSWTLKIELYKQSDAPEATNGVISVAKFEHNCGYSVEYKAHFVDAEHNLIGLQINDYNNTLVTSNPNANRYKYLLLRYDPEAEIPEFEIIPYIPEYAFISSVTSFDSGCDYARAFYEHNGVYVFGSNDFTFIKL